MKTPDFLKKHATALSDFQRLISDKPTTGIRILYKIHNRISKEHNTKSSVVAQNSHNTDNSSNHSRAQNTTPPELKTVTTDAASQIAEREELDVQCDNTNDNSTSKTRLFYFHVMSKCHVDAYILERPEAKKIFENECLHYARVCEIAITNYCIMDNHFHLNVGVRALSLDEAREKLAKMMGSIKQQFTRRFKLWYNTAYRKEVRHRKPKLGTGTLWAGPIQARFIKDDAQLAATTLYIEANYIKVSCADQIKTLSQPPAFANAPLCENFGVQPEYNPLLYGLYNNQSQSARFYLGDAATHDNTALTDGLDGNWASEEDVKKHWHLPAYSLPTNWRKVHYGNERKILKPTCKQDRSYHTTPFVARLGQKPTTRRRNFARLVLSLCWKSRDQIVNVTRPIDQKTQGPGVNCNATSR